MDTEHAREFEEHGLQSFRIERGAEVLGKDGSLGTVEQIVVDGESGELQSLVVRGEAGMSMELPASSIESATGEQVYLSISRSELAAHPELSRPFKPELYIPVDQGAVVPPGEAINRDPDAPLLTEMEEDSIEIVAPMGDEHESDLLLDGGNGDGLDIADQPTIVLGPSDEQLAATQPVESQATSAAGLVGGIDDTDEELEAEELTALESSDVRPGVGALDDMPLEPLTPSGDEIVSIAEVELAVPLETPLTTPSHSETATASRVPEGASFGDGASPGRDLAVYMTGGVLAATAAASIAYLIWSRRQRMRSRQLPSLSAARAQLDSVRSAGAAAQQALSAQSRGRLANLAPRARDLGARSADAAARAQASAGDLWDRVAGRVTGRVAALGTLIDQLPSLDTNSLGKRLNTASENVQDWLDDATDAVRTWKPDLGGWMKLGAAGRASRLALPSLSWRPMRRAATTVVRQVPTTAAAHKANEARRGMRRGLRRVNRRVRWFRRGMIAGAIWGVLYAPVAGREARTVVARYLSQVPYLRDYIGSATQRSERVGGTGPHPRSDVASAHAPYPGLGTETPLLDPTSEEPLLPAPESDIGSLPGAPTL